jgi:hypothetical protein
MRLLLSGLFNFKVGRAFAHFVLEFVAGLLEFPQALANSAGKFGQLLRPEKQDYNHEDKESFGPTGHTECDW